MLMVPGSSLLHVLHRKDNSAPFFLAATGALLSTFRITHAFWSLAVVHNRAWSPASRNFATNGFV